MPFWMMEVEPCVRVKRGVGTFYVPVRKVVEASHVLFGEDDHGAIVASVLKDTEVVTRVNNYQKTRGR